MAKRNTPPREAARKILIPAELRSGIDRLKKRIEELEAFDPRKMTESHPAELRALSTSIQATLARVFGEDTPDYNLFLPAIDLQWSASLYMGGGSPTPLSDYRDGIAENRRRSLATLRQAVRTLEEDLAEATSLATTDLAQPSQTPLHLITRKVFVVHGHDEAALQAVARFLEQLGLEAIVLREQPDQGRTIIEKFEALANEVGFAVVLLTPDDLAGPADAQGSRARQNVIFELGYFVGKLGRGRACLLRKGAIEIPSDLYGVIYSDMDAADGWKLKLVRELKAAKLDFDANRMWS
jgi:predicted nucleotide-binding protein